MNKEIIVFSNKEATKIFLSIGIEAYISDNVTEIRNEIRNVIALGAKILIIDEELNEDIKDIKEHYDNIIYPIFLSLPMGESSSSESLNELKEMIEKAIGFSIN